MLVLNADLDVPIHLFIGERLLGSITTVELRNGRIRLGFDFPSEVVIVRDNVKKVLPLPGANRLQSRG